MDKQKEKEAQKRYMELQLLEQQMKQLQKNAKQGHGDYRVCPESHVETQEG